MANILAWRSWTWTGSWIARRPISSVAPMTWPPLTPPPASQMLKPYGLWSRPRLPPPLRHRLQPRSRATQKLSQNRENMSSVSPLRF